MSLILLDLAYITVKSISYLGYYTYQGLSEEFLEDMIIFISIIK